MIEIVNPAHPDKIADRISGALVDIAYKLDENPSIAVEVLLGHGECSVIVETSVLITEDDIIDVVNRINPGVRNFYIKIVRQDPHLFKNHGKIRCGDNGIFKGSPFTDEERRLSKVAHLIYEKYPCDGKYILDDERKRCIICQSNYSFDAVLEAEIKNIIGEDFIIDINPLGPWTGGYNTDSGCTNRKLGSDMGHSLTGGGLHGKDLSKADITLNLLTFIKAEKYGENFEVSCAIGDEEIAGDSYSELISDARYIIDKVGGFEKFAEWGYHNKTFLE